MLKDRFGGLFSVLNRTDLETLRNIEVHIIENGNVYDTDSYIEGFDHPDLYPLAEAQGSRIGVDMNLVLTRSLPEILQFLKECYSLMKEGIETVREITTEDIKEKGYTYDIFSLQLDQEVTPTSPADIEVKIRESREYLSKLGRIIKKLEEALED